MSHILVKLVKVAKSGGSEFHGIAKRLLIMQGRYIHARQMKRARKEIKKLKIYSGRVTRDGRRKIAGEEMDEKPVAPLPG